MKKVTTMFFLVLAAVCASTAHAQSTCMKDCDQDQKQCMAKQAKVDVWGNKLVTPEAEKACAESTQTCQKKCLKASMAK